MTTMAILTKISDKIRPVNQLYVSTDLLKLLLVIELKSSALCNYNSTVPHWPDSSNHRNLSKEIIKY